MPCGHYLEYFTVGEFTRHLPGRMITETDNTWFALLTMNQHPLQDGTYRSARGEEEQP